MEGLAAAAKIKPGLIILDITMPVMPGTEMLERLKGDADLKNIPVIMLTAESGKDNVLNIVKQGVKDYMVKPFKGEDLIERVRKITERLVAQAVNEALSNAVQQAEAALLARLGSVTLAALSQDFHARLARHRAAGGQGWYQLQEHQHETH